MDHSTETTAVNGMLASDGDIVAAATEEDAAVSTKEEMTSTDSKKHSRVRGRGKGEVGVWVWVG